MKRFLALFIVGGFVLAIATIFATSSQSKTASVQLLKAEPQVTYSSIEGYDAPITTVADSSI